MLFFIFSGYRGEIAEIGPAGIKPCPRCHKDAPFLKLVAYRVRHIYGLFRWVTRRTPYLQCDSCGGEFPAGARDISRREASAAIPLRERYSWTIGAGAIAGLSGLIFLAAQPGAIHDADDIAFAEAPKVGDVYETDMARIVTAPERPMMMAAMRIAGIKDGVAQLEMARDYYSDWRGVDRDIDAGLTESGAYYAPARLDIPLTALKKMFDDGVVHDIHRPGDNDGGSGRHAPDSTGPAPVIGGHTAG